MEPSRTLINLFLSAHVVVGAKFYNFPFNNKNNIFCKFYCFVIFIKTHEMPCATTITLFMYTF